jgi:hypothetical protein
VRPEGWSSASFIAQSFWAEPMDRRGPMIGSALAG